MSVIAYIYYSNISVISCLEVCIDCAGHRRISVKEDKNGLSKTISNTTLNNVKTSSIIRRTKNEVLIKYDKEFDPVTHYLQKPRSVTIFLSDRMTSGFSNRLRAMRGLLILAILNNASFCVKYDHYFSIMDEQLKVLSCKPNVTGQFWDHPYVISKFRKNPCDYHIKHNTEIRTNDDISNLIVKCRLFKSDFEHIKNIIKSNNMRNYISRYFFRPKPYIISYGNSILSKMTGIKIGIQLRFGGNTASSHENFTFLNPKKMDVITKRIKRVISQRRTSYSIFLSSDSPEAKNMLSSLHIPVLTADKYQIGHTNRNNYTFYERAITDLYVLSKCDILFHTYWSSYGQIAKDLSRSQQFYLLKN